MNGPPPKRTAELMDWLRETFELVASDIAGGTAPSKDLREAMGFMKALRIDTRDEVMRKARAIDAMCVRELSKRRLKTERTWLQQLENVAAELAESSTDVASDLDLEILNGIREEAKDLRRHWCSRVFRRMCRQVRRIVT